MLIMVVNIKVLKPMLIISKYDNMENTNKTVMHIA